MKNLDINWGAHKALFLFRNSAFNFIWLTKQEIFAIMVIDNKKIKK